VPEFQAGIEIENTLGGDTSCLNFQLCFNPFWPRFCFPPEIVKPGLLNFHVSLIGIIADYNDYQKFVKGG
jgi:hypothetical protein